LDLLTGTDIFSSPSGQLGASLNAIPTATARALPPAWTPHFTESNLTAGASVINPLVSHSSVPPALQFPYPTIPHSSTPAAGKLPQPSLQPQGADEFANFDLQFNSLTVGNGSKQPVGNQISPVNNCNSLSQSASAFVLGQRPTPPPLPQSQPVVWPVQPSDTVPKSPTSSSPQPPKADSASLREGSRSELTIMKNTQPSHVLGKLAGDEVDYSALEELYRDSATQKPNDAAACQANQQSPAKPIGASSFDFDPFAAPQASTQGCAFGNNFNAPLTKSSTAGGGLSYDFNFPQNGGATSQTNTHLTNSNSSWNPFA